MVNYVQGNKNKEKRCFQKIFRFLIIVLNKLKIYHLKMQIEDPYNKFLIKLKLTFQINKIRIKLQLISLLKINKHKFLSNNNQI